ncbi:hypothetical protein [Streptomyces axinellae]|uniref:Tetratricopeptide repeat protein n=1 Tax=Streptomyces axinellae TaxID=552788 RepID=A0ABP6CL93_9ACTN
MSSTPARSPEQIREDIRAQGGVAHGPGRLARAEELLAEAERSADPAALAEALLQLAAARRFGTPARTTAGPVGRALRLWDEQPDAFAPEAVRELLWSLRWAAEDAIEDPDVPAAAVAELLAELSRRHATASLSQRPVHAREFLAAVRLGDEERAAPALASWHAAPRDEAADCRGCELAWEGAAHARRATLAEAADRTAGAAGASAAGAAEDAEALRLWEPVLRGEHDCRSRPSLLAAALLPLLRLGRADEARRHHLAGYPAVREDPAERTAVAHHLEFCARTGNEPRGLRLLAEQDPHRWEAAEDPASHGDWMAAVAVLMRRLVALGHGAMPVPGPPERRWTAAALREHATREALAVAARFDRRIWSKNLRNENPRDEHGEEGREGEERSPGERSRAESNRRAALARIEAGPLSGHLPLGLGTGPLAPRTGERAAAEAGDSDPRALLVRARALSVAGRPGALAVWAELAEAVARTGVRLTEGEQAELLDHRAMELTRTDPEAGAAAFTEAAGRYAGAGMPGEALACRARALQASSFAPDPDPGHGPARSRSARHTRPAQEQPGRRAGALLAEAETLCAEAEAQHAAGQISTRHATAVLLTRARLRAAQLGAARRAGESERGDGSASRDGGGAAGAERDAASDIDAETLGAETLDAQALDAELERLIAFAEPDADEPAVLARIAEATETRGRLAAQYGDPAHAERLLTEAAALCHRAERPWAATGPELALGRLLLENGRHTRAAEVLDAALADPERTGTAGVPADLARLHSLLAEAYAAAGRPEEEAEALWHAARWWAEADGAAQGARVGLRLGGCLLGLERTDEAAAVLEAALPGLFDAGDEPGTVQACVWLTQTCRGPGQLLAASRLLRRTAGAPHPWQDPHGHAVIAHLAADTLRGSGEYDEARAAYARAEELWRALEDTHGVVRTLHARAWLAAEAGGPPVRSLALMDAAQREIEAALRDGPDADRPAAPGADDEQRRLQLRLETGHTHRQTAELLAEYDHAPENPEHAHTARVLAHVDLAVGAFRACGEAGLHDATGAELRAAGLEADLGRYEEAVERLTRVRAAYPAGTPDPYGTVAERLAEAGQIELRIENALR